MSLGLALKLSLEALCQYNPFLKSVLQSCAAAKMKNLVGHWTIEHGRQNGRLLHWPQNSCVSMKTTLWKLLVSVSAKFDCPVSHQECPLLPTAHDCETGFSNLSKGIHRKWTPPISGHSTPSPSLINGHLLWLSLNHCAKSEIFAEELLRIMRDKWTPSVSGHPTLSPSLINGHLL